MNLGSPDSTDVKDVRRYLDEFLMDERVIDIPYWKRFLLIKGIILNVRPKKSAEAYKKIWWKEGSPLIVISERFAAAVRKKVDLPVALGMRYGSMSMEKSLDELKRQGVEDVYLVPLYPHYAMSSFETVVEKAQSLIETTFQGMKMEVMPPFYNKSAYIKVMSQHLEKELEGFDYDQILFSYHGIPERHIYKADTTGAHCKIDGTCCEVASEAHKTCYRHQCFETTKGIVKELGIEEGKYRNSFQSRLLKDPWLKPYTDHELEAMPAQGIKNLAVITPAFVADCLETLEEIAMEGEQEFLEMGGENFKHISCLNEDEAWVDVMVEWINNWSSRDRK